MSYLDARTQYRRAQETSLPETMDPHQIVHVTLTELHRALAILALAQREGHPLAPERMNRALTAIYILQSSLDFDQGGEIAQNLYRVYEFVRLQLVAAFRREPGAALAAAEAHVGSILEAWRAMPGRAA
ncbi:MAG: flagellar protein FliS [Cypionkella sp.]|jgi:flagellar protein FliS|nr:flagellar protein FliS [Cypionkella sp.]